MKQKIEFEIDVPEGKKVVLKDNKVVFEDIKPQLPKTWEEFCKTHPLKEREAYIDCNSTIKITCRGRGKRLNKSDRSYLPSTKAAEQHLALMQLHQLRDCYRQGWIPDWKDENSIKYAIVYNCSGELIVEDYAVTPMFLSFQSEELAKEFINNFCDLIEQAGDLI